MALAGQKHFEQLRQRILALGLMVEEAVAKAVRVVRERNETLAREVIASDSAIDRAEILVEEDCLKFLALHQPAARDLRFTIAVLKVNSDLERMGDLAKNICKRVLFLMSWNRQPFPVDFLEIASLAQTMIRQALDALVDGDADLARKVWAQDQKLDKTYHKLQKQIFELIRTQADQIEPLMRLFAIARHFERLGDMAAHVAQEVIHVVDADIVRHQAGL